MAPKVGRAAWVGERAHGEVDAGAAAWVLITAALADVPPPPVAGAPSAADPSPESSPPMTSSEPRRVVDGVVQYPMADGTTIPQLGFGVWRVDDDSAEVAVAEALRVGYRHIDGRKLYHNDGGAAGRCRTPAFAHDEVYVTTKLSPTTTRATTRTLRRLDASLQRLGIDQVDLYLIHWAAPSRDRYVDTWRAFDRAADASGRSIGVSNFQSAHLDRIIGETGVTPIINQIELPPLLPTEAPARRRRATTASSPNRGRRSARARGCSTTRCSRIAAGHDASPAQVVIAWHLALDRVVIPKSVTPRESRRTSPRGR